MVIDHSMAPLNERPRTAPTGDIPARFTWRLTSRPNLPRAVWGRYDTGWRVDGREFARRLGPGFFGAPIARLEAKHIIASLFECRELNSAPGMRSADFDGPIGQGGLRLTLVAVARENPLPEPNIRQSSLPAVDKAARSLQLAIAAARAAEENRGREIVVLDVRNLTSIFDYFVIATGTSRRQLHAMSEEIDHRLVDEMGDERLGIEGYAESRWILLDYGTVVIHLFDDETRAYFALEELWAEASRVPWQHAEVTT